MDGLFYGRLEKVQMVKVPPPLTGKIKKEAEGKTLKPN